MYIVQRRNTRLKVHDFDNLLENFTLLVRLMNAGNANRD
jgi:hypothetical protein